MSKLPDAVFTMQTILAARLARAGKVPRARRLAMAHADVVREINHRYEKMAIERKAKFAGIRVYNQIRNPFLVKSCSQQQK